MTWIASMLAFLSYTNLSISLSISFSWVVNWMMRFIISSFCPSFSNTYFACGFSVGGNLSYFFNATMSAFFFLMSSSANLMFLGSFPTSMTNYSNDFIFLSLACEEPSLALTVLWCFLEYFAAFVHSWLCWSLYNISFLHLAYKILSGL